jgi:linoleoyl-CoA desaturase
MQVHTYLKEITNQYSSTYFEVKSQKILVKKLILFYTIWLFFYLLFIFTSNLIILLLIAASLGFINFLLAINLGHDALHRKMFKYSLFQFLSKHTFTICGIDIGYWKISHNIHHANPNIIGVDTDIETRTIPFLKLYSNNLSNYLIRYQHLYFPLLYLFTSLWWFSLKDFSATIVEIKENKSSFVKLSAYFLRKIFHLCLFLFIPLFYAKGFIMSVVFFIIIHFVQGLSMALLFQVTTSL